MLFIDAISGWAATVGEVDGLGGRPGAQGL